MTQSEWLEAISRMANMIEKYLPHNGAAVAEQWRLYKAMLMNRSNFASEFSSYLAYDIHIRKAYYQFSDEFLLCIPNRRMDKHQRPRTRTYHMWCAINPGPATTQCTEHSHTYFRQQPAPSPECAFTIVALQPPPYPLRRGGRAWFLSRFRNRQ